VHHGQHAAVCLEMQRFANAVNARDAPLPFAVTEAKAAYSQRHLPVTVLQAGDVYCQTTRHRFRAN